METFPHMKYENVYFHVKSCHYDSYLKVFKYLNDTRVPRSHPLKFQTNSSLCIICFFVYFSRSISCSVFILFQHTIKYELNGKY